jgi:hypothetical protein
MKPIPEDTTQVVRQGVERACKDFSDRIFSLGFKRTKKMFWTRRHTHTVDFVHFHRSGSSYGKPINYSVDFRVHFGIRVLNDPFEAAALNGPRSDPTRTREGRYHLRFNAQTGSTYERCLDDLVRFVQEQGEPWFSRFKDTKALLTKSDSPIREIEKDHLRLAIEGRTDPAMEAQSLKILGIKE